MIKRRFLNRLLPLVVVVVAAWFGYQQSDPGGRIARDHGGEAMLARAIAERQSGVQVQGEGTVVRLLPDDNEGSRHQRFIVRLASGQTLLIAHNIDLAPRVASVAVGDRVGFYGEYEWNERGGVIHWTHGDPRGWHDDGWIEHRGHRYQ